jgi:hypothetical protein
MSKEKVFSVNWIAADSKIDVRLPIIIFKENDTEIAYCPALDLSGYGMDESSALDSFNISLSEFLKYTLNKKTLFSNLKELGWIIDKKKPMHPPEFSASLENNKYFSDIFNNLPFKKINELISIPLM